MSKVDEHAQLLEHILHQNRAFAHAFAASEMQLGGESRWLSLDLTMPQLKAVMTVVLSPDPQGVTVGQLAKRLGVGLPTASGIVDRLYEHGFVARQEDPEDRRVTRVTATEKSLEIVERLNRTDHGFWHRLLDGLETDDLRTISRAFDILLNALHKNLTLDCASELRDPQ